jgi:hypothetical protein
MRLNAEVRKEMARLGISEEQLKRSISIAKNSGGVPPAFCEHHFQDGVCGWCGALEAALNLKVEVEEESK